MSRLPSEVKHQLKAVLEEVEKFVVLGLEYGIFTDKSGRKMTKNDNLGFSYPGIGKNWFFKFQAFPYKRYKQQVEAWIKKNMEFKVHFPDDPIDQRHPTLQHLDLRTEKQKRISILKEQAKARKIGSDYKPPKPLPKELLEKLTDTNKPWLEKQLDRDAEKPDEERRFT